jgi:hypothetical protein
MTRFNGLTRALVWTFTDGFTCNLQGLIQLCSYLATDLGYKQLLMPASS